MNELIDQQLNDEIIEIMMDWMRGEKLREREYYFVALNGDKKYFYGITTGFAESTTLLTAEDGTDYPVSYYASMKIQDTKTHGTLKQVKVFVILPEGYSIFDDPECAAQMIANDSQVSFQLLAETMRETIDEEFILLPNVITIETLKLISILGKELICMEKNPNRYLHCVLTSLGLNVFPSTIPPSEMTENMGSGSECPNDISYVGGLKLQNSDSVIGTAHIHKEIEACPNLKSEILH